MDTPIPSHPLDAHLRTILENVRLVYLLERQEKGWDATPNWEDILSLGEQQRLGMVSRWIFDLSFLFTFSCFVSNVSKTDFYLAQARLFFHHPKFGILDECTK